MNANVVKNDDNTVVVTVKLEGDAWKKAQKKALAKAKNKMNLKGFRKGQAPDAVVKKMMGEEYLLYQAVDEEAGKILSDAVEENNIELIDRPELKVENATPESVDLVFVCPIAPEAKLGEWKNLGIKKEEVSVADDEVEAVLKQMAQAKAENVLVEDKPAENGNQVDIDFTGLKDGVAFEGGSAQGQTLVLGSGTFIPGFEEQIVGMSTGEEKDINVTFPEDYHAADLAGQPVVFKVKVNEIYETKLPEFNDEFAKEAKDYDVETIDALREAIKANLLAQKQEKADDAYFEALLNTASENAEVEVPQVMVDDEAERMLQMQANQFKQYGIDFESYLKMAGTTLEAAKDQAKEQAESRVRSALVLQAIADAENVVVTDEEVEKEMENLAEAYHLDLDRVKAIVKAADVKKDLRMDKASQILIDAQ